MQTIKFLKNNKIKLTNTIYKPYTICDLPNSFGESEEIKIEGKNSLFIPKIDHWLKLPSPNKGLIYIAE